MGEVQIHIVVNPDEDWVCIPQDSNTVVLNKANIGQLSSAHELLRCVLMQAEAQSYLEAGVPRDD